jgi:hypothetical protein
MNSTLAKILTWVGIIVGILGAGVGIYASINPMGLADFMSNPAFTTWVPYVFGGFIFLVVGLSLLPVFGLAIQGLKNIGIKGRLRQNGTKTTATILSLQDTGVTINMNPLVRLTVQTKSGIKGEFKSLVSRVGFPSPGDEIEVVYNPSNPSEMMLASQLQ